jgi:hypothetical protein
MNDTDMSRRRYLRMLSSGTVFLLAGCVGGGGEPRPEPEVTQDDIRSLEERVSELEEAVNDVDDENSRTFVFSEDQVVIRQNDQTGAISVFSVEGEFDVLGVQGPDGETTSTEDPANTPVTIGGEEADLEYVPGGRYEILGRVGNRDGVITTYTAPMDTNISGGGSDNEDDEETTEDEEQDSSGEGTGANTTNQDRNPGVAVSFTEDVTRRELDIYVRSPDATGEADADVLRVRWGDEVFSVRNPSPGDTVEIGGIGSEIEYRSNETYTVIAERGGVNITVGTYTTEDIG